MQIHELNEYPLNPSDGDWLIVDTGKDTAKVGGERFAYKTDVEVLSKEVSKVVINNNGYRIDALWTGSMYAGGDSAALTNPIANYDYIDIYTYFLGATQIYTTEAVTGDLFIRNQNIADETSSNFLVVWELKLVLSAQAVGLEFNHRWRWSGSSSASATMTSNDSGMRITKIVGRKCVVNQTDTEVEDIRVGADGTVYNSAGEAVRDQVGDLDTRLSRYETIFTADVDQSVSNWLDEHPEATTTVEDGSITEAKLANDVKAMIEKVSLEPCYVYAPFRSNAHTGDCTILKCGSEVILVDLGHVDDASAIVSFMVAHGLTTVTRCIITHFHYDHVGGCSGILGSNQLDFSDCVFYMHPQLDASRVTGNASYLTYESDVTTYIRNMGRQIVYPTNNTITEFNKYLSCRWLNTDPTEWDANNYYTDFTDSYGNIGTATNMNNFSVVSELIHGNNHILLPGDLERLSQGVVEPYITVSPIVYKLEHHGVNEVANADYMSKINPEFTIVEGTGFIDHFLKNPMSLQLIDYNRHNVYAQQEGKKDTILMSNGYDVCCLEGTDNVVNNTMLINVTVEELDGLMRTGDYRLNGVSIPSVADYLIYGYIKVCSKGTFTTQEAIDLKGLKFSRSYTTGSGHWSVWRYIQPQQGA